MISYRLGRRRQFDECIQYAGSALLMLGLGWAGALLAAIVVGLQRWARPASQGILVISAADVSRHVRVSRTRVVLSRPHRVVYDDEVSAQDFSRLRRICLGRTLPVRVHA